MRPLPKGEGTTEGGEGIRSAADAICLRRDINLRLRYSFGSDIFTFGKCEYETDTRNVFDYLNLRRDRRPRRSENVKSPPIIFQQTDPKPSPAEKGDRAGVPEK